MKRKFTINHIPVASLLGKILLKSKESKQIIEAIRNLINKGEITSVILSDETVEKINAAKLKKI